MTIQKTLLTAIKKLQKSNLSPHLDAEVLLSFTINKPKGYLLSHKDNNLTAAQINKYNKLIQKRARGVPVAYLTYTKEFYNLEFIVNENVLIPRPETETLIEEAIKCLRIKLKNLKQEVDAKRYDTLTVADIGTGSGCIAITLAKYMPDIGIFATDISDKALNVAKKNARSHKVSSKITFKKGDLLKPFIKKQSTKFDIITANLPYLTKDELVNVRHEPKTALHGGKMGLELVEKLIAQADQVLNPDGIMLLEISPTQVKTVDYLVEQHLPNKKVFFIKDLGERDRVAKIE